VAASAHALRFPYFTLDHTLLSAAPYDGSGNAVLVEIGTGVGVACSLPNGQVISSEAVRIHASNGVPYGLNLCGSQGFRRLVAKLQAQGLTLPESVEREFLLDESLGPLITALIAQENSHSFVGYAGDQYARYLGEFLGTLQLAFNAAALFIGGSVGRAPGFLERIVARQVFWQAFAKKDALRNKTDMPILRVDNDDATVMGAYAAGWQAAN